MASYISRMSVLPNYYYLNGPYLTTMKIGYNEQLGEAKFVRYNREFIITGVVNGIIHRFETIQCVHYKREFVITEFVITEFVITEFVISEFFITEFVITEFVITEFVITKFVITEFVITKFDCIYNRLQKLHRRQQKPQQHQLIPNRGQSGKERTCEFPDWAPP
jgi:hypothetical protein